MRAALTFVALLAASAGPGAAAPVSYTCFFPRTCSGDLGCRERLQSATVRPTETGSELSLGSGWTPLREIGEGAPTHRSFASVGLETPAHMLTVRENGAAMLTLHAGAAAPDGVALTLYGECGPPR